MPKKSKKTKASVNKYAKQIDKQGLKQFGNVYPMLNLPTGKGALMQTSKTIRVPV